MKKVERKFMNLVEIDDDHQHLDASEALYADELQTRWKDLVQRVRVHEMLKCMKVHHKRLKVLHEHTDLDEMLLARQKFDLVNQKSVTQHHDHEGDTEDEEEESEEEDENTKLQKEIDKKHEEILNQGIDTLFLRTQAEEEELITTIYPPLKKVLADPKYVVKCAIRMFRTRSDITEEDFEAILELCQDKLEKQALKDAYEENKNREKYLHNADERRKMLYEFVNSRLFVRFMLLTIIVSIVGIFLLTFERIYIHYAFPIIILDNCIIGIFVVEATFKITIYKEDYFKKPWNLLDILIILVNFIEVVVELITKTLALKNDINETLGFKMLKSLRALRLLRIIKFLPNLQVVVNTIFQSLLSLGSIAVLMSLFIFVFAVMGRGLFAEISPDNFGKFWLALVTLFQLLTMDDWFELLQDLDENDDLYWMMFFYLFFYIVIENFIFLNLFVAVLVDNFQLTLAATEIEKTKEALIYLEEKDNFAETFEELDEKAEEYDDVLGKQTYMDKRKPEMDVPDYFPVADDSREKVLLEHIFKDLCALDFERFLWKRRLSIVHTVMDKAIFVHVKIIIFRTMFSVKINTTPGQYKTIRIIMTLPVLISP